MNNANIVSGTDMRKGQAKRRRELIEAAKRDKRAMMLREYAVRKREKQIKEGKPLPAPSKSLETLRRRVIDPVSHKKVVPTEAMLALRKKGLSYKAIAQMLQCSYPTVAKRLKDIQPKVDYAKSFREARADLLAIKQNEILTSMTVEDIAEETVKNRAVAFGILYDKERLETGKSTQNISYAEIMIMRDRKMSELRQIEDGGYPDEELYDEDETYGGDEGEEGEADEGDC